MNMLAVRHGDLARAQRWVDRHYQLVLILILVLGLGLRTWRLAAQDIWWDEASSALQAPMSLADITLYQARDQHPPLYYWQLHFYYRLTGSSLFALRFFSVIWGVLGILIAYLLGKRMFRSVRIGLLGAFLLAISRFHVAWCQEIKMYAMLSTMSMASLLLMWYILEDRGWMLGSRRPIRLLSNRSRLWLYAGYVIVTILSIYCHYIALLGLVAQNLYVIVAARFRRHRHDPWWDFLWRWGAGQALVLAVAIPWFLLHAENTASWTASETTPPLQALHMVATLLSQGVSAYVERYTAQTVLLWVPILGGHWLALRLRDRAGMALLWLSLLSTAILAYVMTLPVFSLGYEAKLAARFFVMAVTPYCLLSAHAIQCLSRKMPRCAALVLVFFVALQLASLGSHYRERYPRDSYDTLVSTIQSLEQDGDAVLLMNDSEWPVFTYHYDGNLPIRHVPYGAQGGEALIEPYVAPALAEHDGLWLVLNVDSRRQDGNQEVLAWLRGHAEVVLNEPYGQRRLVLLRKEITEICANVPGAHSPDSEADVTVDAGLRLVGVDQALREARAGQRLSLISYWEVAHGERYAVRAKLVEPRSGLTVAESDRDWLGAGSVGCNKRLRLDIPISRQIDRGPYAIVLIVAATDGEETGIVAGHTFVRGATPQRGQADMQPLGYDLGSAARLSGYAISDSMLEPGQTVRVTLQWECLDEMDTSYVTFVHLLGDTYNPEQGNTLWGQADVVPLAGTYPTDVWTEGDTVEDEIELVLADNAPPGEYAIEIGLYDPNTGQRLQVTDGDGGPMGDLVIIGHVQAETASGWRFPRLDRQHGLMP